MPIISLQRHIKLTNEDVLKIIHHKPSKKLQNILKSIESKNNKTPTENKLISKYLQKNPKNNIYNQQFKEFLFKHIPQIADLFLNKFAINHYYYLDYKGSDDIALDGFLVRTNLEREHDTNFISLFRIDATKVEPKIDGDNILYKPSLKKIIRKEITKL